MQIKYEYPPFVHLLKCEENEYTYEDENLIYLGSYIDFCEDLSKDIIKYWFDGTILNSEVILLFSKKISDGVFEVIKHSIMDCGRSNIAFIYYPELFSKHQLQFLEKLIQDLNDAIREDKIKKAEENERRKIEAEEMKIEEEKLQLQKLMKKYGTLV